MEIRILNSFLKDRELWDKYSSVVGSVTKDQPEFKELFTAVDMYYERYTDHNYISIDELKTFIDLEVKPKHPEVFDLIYMQLSNVDTSESLIEDVIKDIIGRDCANSLLLDLHPVLEGTKRFDPERLETIIERYRHKADIKAEETGFEPTPEDLLQVAIRTDGWSWPLRFLNDNLGALNGGRLGHVFAYVSVGKTSFAACCIAHWLKQGARVCHFNNEEKGSKVYLRVLLSYLQITNEQYATNPNGYFTKFKESVGDAFKLVDNALLTVSQIEREVQLHKPDIILVDIADKVSFRGDNNMTEVLRIKGLYAKYRELAKTYPIDVVTLGQGDASTGSKKVLKKNHMDYSKVGKPGELDYALGIGKEEADLDTFVRYMSICKNKDGEECYSTALLDPHKSTYREM